MKLAWTARARIRLAELHAYVAQDSKPRALAIVERILDRAETLLVAPRSGVQLQSFVDDEVRELLERPYRIIYRVSATGIEILTVKYSRQRLIDRPGSDSWGWIGPATGRTH